MSDSPRRQRTKILGSVLLVLALLGVLAAPAGSGVATDQLQLEAREAELMNDIGEYTRSIERLEFERPQLIAEIRTLTAAIEGNSAAAELLTIDRQLQSEARVAMALDHFVNGGVGNALGAEADALAALDADIRSLQADIPQLTADREEVARKLETVDAALLGFSIGVENATGELAVVANDLDWYRSDEGRSPITGRPNPHGNDRPALVIKIDNVTAARPQAAVNQADLVFVEMVEFGLTRLAATFHSQEAAVVGPVRSMRTTDVDLLRMLNQPLFANSGANARTTNIVNNSPLVNIGAATDAGGAYYRNGSRPVPHNLFTSTGALRREGGDRGGSPPQIFTVRRPGTPLPNASVSTNGVDISYPNSSVSYRWNGSGWARSQDGASFRDITGVRVAPETLIVRFTTYGVSAADSNSPEARVTGSGTAWIFTEGRLIEGTWEKPRARDVTVYKDADGAEVNLLPGRVWVEIPPPDSGTLR